MQIKMAKVLNLNPIYQKVKAQVLPVKTAYKFSKLFNVLDKEAHFYSEELNKLIMEYAERDETGAPKMIDNGTGVQLQKEYIGLVQSVIVYYLLLFLFLNLQVFGFVFQY